MLPSDTLALTVLAEGRSYPLRFPVRRVLNAGYVGRNQQAVCAHIEELRREGVPAPDVVPMLFALSTDKLTTSERIEVIGAETSGEAEYVLLLNGGEVFVAVGSDHTDRELERHSLVKSKQMCSNVMSRTVWRYREVREHWDSLRLESWVYPTGADQEVLYQSAELRSILSADQLLDLVRSRLKDSRDAEGLVLFSGTIPLLTGNMIYSDSFRAELVDPASGQRLACKYRVARLDYV